MSNFNDKIQEYTGDGIPAYNRKINEIIRKLNWLMGMRSINGKPITESDQGPVFDLAPAGSVSDPWAADPDGNAAGWLKGLVTDPNYVDNGQFDLCWMWTGAVESNPLIPWMSDPDGTQAQWVQHQVCENGATVNKWFWGTP